jgi:hypothetical protein
MLGCSARTFSADLECVKAVLRLWDPIGVFPEGYREARDEYDSYAPRMLSLLCSDAPAASLAAELECFRTNSIGLEPDQDEDLKTARRLLALRGRLGGGFESDGYFIAASRIAPDECATLLHALPATRGGRGGVRQLLANEAVLAFVRSAPVSSIVRPITGDDSCAVQATLFDKTQGANWKVAWHQDRTGALAGRLDIPGFDRWRIRGGIHHAELPHAVLERMVALRLHLDDCSGEDGPLRVIPGSHLLDKLREPEIAKIASGLQRVTLPVTRGDILVMRPLLLHASSAAHRPAHRRVLHIEFAPREAVFPAQWAEQIAVR